MPVITVNGIQKEYDKGTTFEEIAKDFQKDYEHRIACVIFNGKIRELMKTLKKDGNLTFVTFADTIGFKTMRRTAVMMLLKAINDVAGTKKKSPTKVEFALGNGIYCTLRGIPVTDEFVKKVSDRMKELAADAMPVVKKVYPLDEAIELFTKQGMDDKVSLLKSTSTDSVISMIITTVICCRTLLILSYSSLISIMTE